MNRRGREQLFSILIGGAAAVISFVAFDVFDNQYPAAPGLLVDGYVGALLSGNPHGGFRSALADNTAILLGNFAFYYLLVYAFFALARAWKRRRG